HCPLGPVALAACLQVDFTCWNAMLQEQSIGIHYNQGADLLDYVRNKDDFRCDADGCIAALPGPGLGVEIDEELLARVSREPPRWHNPLWRQVDGSVSEWGSHEPGAGYRHRGAGDRQPLRARRRHRLGRAHAAAVLDRHPVVAAV